MDLTVEPLLVGIEVALVAISDRLLPVSQVVQPSVRSQAG